MDRLTPAIAGEGLAANLDNTRGRLKARLTLKNFGGAFLLSRRT
jgi:hypothetical protein